MKFQCIIFGTRFWKLKIIDEHKTNLVHQGPAKDLVDAYILESLVMKDDGSGAGRLFDGMNPDRQIQQMIADLFSTGTETIQTTLRWATIFALREPELQRRVQKEIDTVVGRKYLSFSNNFLTLTVSSIS